MAGRRAGLFQKYFAFIVLLVSGGLVASGAIGLYFSYQETRNSLVSLQREKALTAAVRIEHFLRDIESQLGWTALPHVDASRDAMENRRLDFAKLLRQSKEVTEIAHLDAAGREQLVVSRLAMNREGAGTDFSAEPRFVEARKANTWFGPVYFRKDTEPYMQISIPEARDRPGVTVVDVNLKFIWDVVSRIRIGQKGIAYVVDEKGFLVAHPDISLVLRKVNLSELPQVKAALAAAPEAELREVPDARDPGGEPVLSAYARVAPTNWRVFVEEPQSAVFAPLYDSILRTVFLLLAGVVISVVASVFLARRMVNPVRVLQQGADRIGSGDLDSQIEVHTGDELEDLAGRFNTMTAQLRESYADLEQKVEVRTAELREALDQQTATADVLKVIGGSPTDVEPVFNAIAQRAVQLGEARAATAFLYDGQRLRYMTSFGWSPEWVEHLRETSPFEPDESRLSGQVVLKRAVVRMDLPQSREDGLPWECRAGLGVPMLRDGQPIGVFNVWWPEAAEIPEKYVRLLQTFADQAVIAIENVRLFNEIQDKSRQLEEANKHKSEFLANMSHELRTPLNAIIGFSEVMLTGMAGNMPEKQKEFIGDIRDSGKHLLALINDILDLSKIEAGRMELDVARFDLQAAMGNAMTLVRGRAERHGIRLASEIGPDVGEYDGDERKFKQIVLNLLTNAVKFTPEGGCVTLGAERSNGAYVFSVHDTGVGIAAQDQEAIFEEFRQVGTDIERKAEGTGLGLALTKRLVELHGGRIRVESTVGSGSTFTFELPLSVLREEAPGMIAAATRIVEDQVERAQFVPTARGGWVFFPRALWPGYESTGFVVSNEPLRLRLRRRTAVQSVIQFFTGAATAGAWLLIFLTSRFWECLALAVVVTLAAIALEYRYLLDMRRDLAGLPVAEGAKPPSWQVIADSKRPLWQLWLGFAFFGAGTAGLLALAGLHIAESPPRWDKAFAMAAMAALASGMAMSYAIGLRTRRLEERNAELQRIVAERTAELERVNRHKSEFLANMSHELRTPLNAIIGFSDVMLSGMAGPLPDKQREFVGDIRDSGRHLLALINDILDLSKIEAGRMELAVAPFEVPVAAAEALALVRERAERHGVALVSALGPEVADCRGDLRKFKQILLNLLTNAVKFTPGGGTVTLRARRLDGDYEFRVEDTGIGIAPEDQPLIFEEFRQVGSDLDRKAEGTGLGLALTRRLVMLHGGDIGVESAPGKGSTFTFTLPIGQA